MRGPGLFREYWGRQDATAAAFDADGFFMTGDVVALDGEQPPYYKARHAMQGCWARLGTVQQDCTMY